MLPVLFITLTALFTYFGGVFAFKYVDKNHLLLAFAGGSVLGVCFFDLIPESIKYSSNPTQSVTLVFIGFLIYYFINQVMPISVPNEDHCENPLHQLASGAWPMCLHSIFDGVGIGLAWQTHNLALGIAVSLAIVLHDFCDGISVVCMLQKASIIDKFTTQCWLACDAIAPMVGFLSTYLYTVSNHTMGLCLSLFSGFLLYIGANFLLPETHHKHSKFNIVFTVLGAAMIYFVIRLAG
jgi:ZIP family zinc transporter